VNQQHDRARYNPFLILTGLWLFGVLCDRVWFMVDQSVPAWDQAQYLTDSLLFQQILQQPQWFSGQWWTHFWQLSPKFAPLTFILTVPFLNIFGTGEEQATLIHSFFSAILLASVYGLGSKLFNRQVGLWAAVFCLFLPGLYRLRLQYLLDFPLTAAVTFSFYCLTMWKEGRRKKEEGRRKREEGRRKKEEGEVKETGFLSPILRFKSRFSQETGFLSSWLWTIAFGVSFGAALLIKQTALLFLFTPLVWLGVTAIFQKAWGKLTQLIISLIITFTIIFPWFKTNWLIIFTSAKRATIDSAISEGDPALNTLNAWTFYWQQLPQQISWPLLLIPIIGLILFWLKNIKLLKLKLFFRYFFLLIPSSFNWLAIFWVGAYFINSLNLNKDDRYVTPYLPVFAILLAYCFTLFPPRWGRQIRWGTFTLVILLTFLNAFPVGGAIGNKIRETFTPGNSIRPYIGKEWPHRDVITEVINSEPFLQNTLVVVPSTAEINQHNFNFYGALENFQIYGREVGGNLKSIPQDVRSLSWFVTKNQRQGEIGSDDSQQAILKELANVQEFQLKKRWLLPDFSLLELYRRNVPLMSVFPLKEAKQKIELDNILLPEKTPPGVPLPVNYEWSGPWQDLQAGIFLITFRNIDNTSNPTASTSFSHDHGVAMGMLNPGKLKGDGYQVGFKVMERMAIFPPANLQPGKYTLEATYLNRKTGQTYPIKVPPVTITIDPTAPRSPAPELDLVTQLRLSASQLPLGIKGLESVFEQVGRINQYDPNQDYTIQAEKALEYRLRQDPNNVEDAYALAFARVLKKDVKGAIASLEKVTQLDVNNPYASGYLAFVYLYDWQPKKAEKVLKRALSNNPNIPELKALNGVASLMEGNIIQAWQDLQVIKKLKL
jgi:4-amino-4-deoxy-L-arabinose transferase-like glycosyltransferase